MELNFFAVIPAPVILDERLNARQKLLVGILNSMSSSKGWCWPTNAYLAKLLGCSKTSVSLDLKQLVDDGYISMVLNLKENGEIDYRAITTLVDKSFTPSIDNKPIDPPFGNSIDPFQILKDPFQNLKGYKEVKSKRENNKNNIGQIGFDREGLDSIQTPEPTSTNQPNPANEAQNLKSESISPPPGYQDIAGGEKVPQIEDFEDFWKLYPRKIAKAPTKRKWKNMTKAQRKAALEALPKHIKQWEGKDANFIPHPSTWLNQERYNDQLESDTFAGIRWFSKTLRIGSQAGDILVQWPTGQWAIVDIYGQVLKTETYAIGTATEIPLYALTSIKMLDLGTDHKRHHRTFKEAPIDEVRQLLAILKQQNHAK